MPAMAEPKKRKRIESHESSQPSEARSPQRIKLSHSQELGEHLPIVVSSRGINVSQNTSYRSYQSSTRSKSASARTKSEILLHSSEHPSLDYTVTENHSNGPESFLKHYVAIYDPTRALLEVVPARRSFVQSTLRPLAAEAQLDAQEDEEASNALSARTKLGLAFGSKKSQKNIKSQAANAIQSSPAKSTQTTAGGSQSAQTLDAASQAVIDSMAKATASMPSRKELQALAEENKPRPRPHLDAEELEDIYPIDELTGGEGVLKYMNVKDWIDKIKNGDDVPTRCLFVARRIVKIVEGGDVKKLKTLRYMLLLFEWYKTLSPSGRGQMKVPKLEAMAQLVEQYGSQVVQDLGKRFAKNGTLARWDQHYLITHILALALTIDGYKSDTYHIARDLQLETREVTKFYNELGCPPRPATDRERAELGITKPEAAAHRHVELKIPLKFPQPKRK